ncbi:MULTISPECIES: S53 family peptidase [Metallosphaera]|uniref:S53 family peptidase n=1 Tax=Metallosphaera TaxID=41980 RepID=UPI001F067820|nr:protease pro-enzyme activation domain-containing protein [Metallosphaera sedula]MCH1771074.1 peptidase S53 [Metallosphaera sedula]MCP6729444.1 protease pro-enzyme activation domain-containing protein [Metallosphaera sedula]
MKNISSILIVLILLVFSSLGSGLVLQAQESVYYVQTSSPQYSILPGSQFVEPLSTSLTIPIAILLNFTNYSSLNSELLYVVSTGHYLTPLKFREYYYPSKSYVKSLENYLKGYGFVPTGNYGLILTFNATVGEIEQAFHTYINVYYYSFKDIYWFGEVGIENVGPFYYFTNNVTPSLPYNVGKYVVGIVGIDSVDPHVYQALRQAWNVPMVKGKGSSSSGLISSAIITPNTIQQYFNFSSLYAQGKTGSGSTIAIEGVPECYVNTTDIYSFWKLFNISRTGSLNVITLGNDTSGGQSGENELDAEYSGAFAPGANIAIVFSDGYVGGKALVGNSLNYYYEYYYMANYLNPDVISISVTLPESYLAAYYPAMLYMIHNIMVQLSVQGTSVLAASGDWGFESDYPPPNFHIGVYNTIWYPESDPLVTSVGGIFLNATSTGQIYSFSGWDYSTGGNSVVFPVQIYELTSVIPFTPVTVRTYPDIAFVSAGGYNIPEFGFGLPLIFDGQVFVWYGTSGAAPMTAAMVSLVGQRLGPLNYALYHISYSGEIITPQGVVKGLPAWIPVTSGNNPFPAHYGWNYVTGPGTYNAYGMVMDLGMYAEYV